MYRLKKPVPLVIEALDIFKGRKFRSVLDLGCGAGRHCIYLAENGFDVVGFDVSKRALRTAKEWVQEEKLTNIEFIRGSMTDISLDGCCFDVVIGVSILHYAMKNQIIKALDEIHRILRKDGLFLTNLVSVEDCRYGKGEEVEASTFRISEDFEEGRFEELHHFFTREEVFRLLSCFTNNRGRITCGRARGSAPSLLEDNSCKVVRCRSCQKPIYLRASCVVTNA